MCEYCKNDGYYKANKSLISKTLKNNVDIDLSINVKDKKLVASVENLAMSVEDDKWFLPTKKINYCPICRTKTSRRWTKKWTKGGQAMTKEEEAIEYTRKRIKVCNENADICDDNNFDEEATYLREESYMLETVLSMLKEKDKLYHKALGDLVKADRENIQLKKQIDLMAEELQKHIFVLYDGNTITSKKGIIEHFERKATNNG